MAELPTGASGAVAESTTALREDALRDRATAPIAITGPTDKVLGQQALKLEPAAATGPCLLDKAQFRDKLRGMLLMGAYADALGAANELFGLGKDGAPAKIADDPIETKLRPFSTYKRNAAEPFGVWIKPVNTAETGIVTDDTSVRMMIVHQWLAVRAYVDQLAASIDPVFAPTRPNEADFRLWLKGMKNEPSGTPPANHVALLQVRKLAIAEILCWMCKADPEADCASHPCGTGFSKDFYTAGVPVVMGQFFFLELAAIYGCCKPDQVQSEFSQFTDLDQLHAKDSTGILAAMLSQAICQDPKKDFHSFFNQQMPALLARLGPTDTLDRAYQDGKAVGEKAGKTLKEILQAIHTQIYNPAKPAEKNGGLGKFDPALFLAMMSAAVQWGGVSPTNILQALAFGVGDSDTIPSQLGSIIGAFYGEQKLRNDFGRGADFDTVEKVLETYFVAAEVAGQYRPFKLDDIVDTLELLAAQHGCCKHV